MASIKVKNAGSNIINPATDEKLDNIISAVSNQHENPFGTIYGQEVISQSETAQDRAIREGKGVCYNFSSNVTTNGNTTIAALAPSTGKILKYAKVVVSCTEASRMWVYVTTGIAGDTVKTISFHVPAFTSKTLDLSNYHVQQGGTISVVCNSVSAPTAFALGNIMANEVDNDA